MTEQAHSYIGPSGASRWTKCPLSAYLARFVGEVRSGKAAIRGSVFHKGLEMALVGEVEPWELIGQQLEVGQDPNTKAVIRSTFTQTMAEQVEELLAWVRRNVPVDAEIGVEVRVSAEHIHSELFGTVDIIARSGSRVWIIDAKTGRVLVDPGTTDAPNPQMALYGYMAGVKKSDQVTLVVYQPNAGDQAFKPLEISGQQLHAWVETVVVPAVAEYDEIQRSGQGTPKPGEHCLYCPSKMLCPDMQKRMERLKDVMLNPEYELADAELVEWLDWSPALKHLLGQFEEEALARLAAGKKLKSGLGFYTEGRSIRKRVWKPAAEQELFAKHGTAIYNNELKTPAALEKVIGKAEVSKYSYTPEGGTKLVRPGEKSAPKRTGAAVFANFSKSEE